LAGGNPTDTSAFFKSSIGAQRFARLHSITDTAKKNNQFPSLSAGECKITMASKFFQRPIVRLHWLQNI
jgi:hypothetical protein